MALTGTETLQVQGQSAPGIPATASFQCTTQDIANLGGGGSTIMTPLVFDRTMTPAGVTGARTINKPAGSVNFAPGAVSLVVTNSLVTANSIVMTQVMTNDDSMSAVKAISDAGFFTLITGEAPTAETRVSFIVFN